MIRIDSVHAELSEKQALKMLGHPVFSDRAIHFMPEVVYNNDERRVFGFKARPASGHVQIGVYTSYAPKCSEDTEVSWHEFGAAHFFAEFASNDRQFCERWLREISDALKSVGVEEITVTGYRREENENVSPEEFTRWLRYIMNTPCPSATEPRSIKAHFRI